MTIARLRIPVKIVESLKEPPPKPSYSGKQVLLKDCISECLCRDETKCFFASVEQSADALRKPDAPNGCWEIRREIWPLEKAKLFEPGLLNLGACSLRFVPIFGWLGSLTSRAVG
ncbi:hypothetical protein [Nevskia sp.]|uniref:hypothetical protein n=1 Tax=Nevskia sp. TaxID=1929292 RepID=UPI0025D99EE6|nr:hypothetical protein [Nevskia sp.]